MADLQLSRERVRDAAYQADLEPDDAIREDYSGRAMYGEKCFGLVGHPSDLLRFFVALLEAEIEDDGNPEVASLLADRVRTDSLGLSTIYYFPGVTLSDE
jgi:hypothetical protein